MISLKEIADNETHISSTRWAFAVIILFDIIVIAITIISYIVAHFIGKPFDISLFNGVALLLGAITGIITTSKVFQGFEKHDKSSEEIK